MQELSIEIKSTDILKSSSAQVLLIPYFDNDSDGKTLFNKIDHKLFGRLLKRAKALRIKSKPSPSFLISIGQSEGLEYEAVYVISLGTKKEFNATDFQKKLAQALREIANQRYSSAALPLFLQLGDGHLSIGKLISEALHLSQYQFLKYKSKEETQNIRRVERLEIFFQNSKFEIRNSKFETELKDLKQGIELGRVISEGVYLTRDLVNEPALSVDPQSLAAQAVEIARLSGGGVEAKILDRRACEKLGMGAFLAVARGSHKEPQFIILHYKGVLGKKKICVVGKAITFDSGGLSLKPSDSMTTMKLDMAGGATVLGLFKVLSQLKTVEHEVWGLIPACENMPGGGAIRPGDIVKALNGTSIEILNTDAEGRLILADALGYAVTKIKPDYIIDLATLTGAVMVALGTDICGLFANDGKLADQLIDAASQVSEALWRLPLHKDYAELMKSNIADLKNVSSTRYGGAITAALFLEHFVDKIKWAHLDIAGAAFNEARVHDLVPKGATGWGVRTLVEYVT